jgi:multidrug efflux pump subunit AcrA (membrane-fusion protein)
LTLVAATLGVGAASSGLELMAQTESSLVAARPRGHFKSASDDEVAVYRVAPGRLRVTAVERGIVEASRTEDGICQVEGGTTILSILPEGTLVSRGQLVCELESSHLQQQLADQSIAQKVAEANYQNAKVAREVAERTLTDFEDDPSGLDQNRLKELRATVEQDRSNERAWRANCEIERGKVAKRCGELANCRLFASSNGLLVHENDPMRGADHPQIEDGATVRERQKIYRIFDISGPMHVNTKVRESMIDQLTPGLGARIHVDAFPKETMTGAVGMVAPLPDPMNWFVGDIKVYTTIVKIDQGPQAVRPGMTAQVEILVGDMDNVLCVPVQTVISHGGRDQVAVKDPGGGFRLREVTLGLHNDDFVEVRQGIESGEIVAIKPPALFSQEEQR